MIEFSIKGGKELNALLQQLPVEVEAKILANGLAAGAAIIRDEAKSLVHKKSGKLADSIKTARSRPGDGTIVAKVRLRGPRAYVGRFLEYGTLAHLIWAKGGSLVINGVAIGKRVEHPGSQAFPFMRPALDTKAAEAVQAVGDYLTRYLSWGTITAPRVTVDLEEAA